MPDSLEYMQLTVTHLGSVQMNSSRIGVIGGRYLLTQSPC